MKVGPTHGISPGKHAGAGHYPWAIHASADASQILPHRISLLCSRSQLLDVTKWLHHAPPSFSVPATALRLSSQGPSQGLGGSPHSSPFLCLHLIYENIFFYLPSVSQSHPNCHCPSSLRILCCWDDLSNMVIQWWAPEYIVWWLLLTERTSLHCPAWYTRLLPRFAPVCGPVCPTLRPHVGLSCSGLSDGPLYLCKYCSFFLTPTSASVPGKLLPICHISGQTPPLKSRPCLTQADWSPVFLYTSMFVHISITTSNYRTVWASPV